MNELDREINTLIMQEIGLEVGENQRIYDQDSGIAIRVNGMDVVAPGSFRGRQTIEFDPHNNRKLMGCLFDYFLEKRAEETDVDVLTYYNKDQSNNAGQIECRMSDNQTVTSKSYKRDSLKYTDIIMQLNGEESVDLSKFDVLPDKSTVKKKKSTAGGKNVGTKN